MTSSIEWLEQQAARDLGRQRAQVETAKLVATFSAGVAATMVATALQVGRPVAWDRSAAWFLAVTILATLVVIACDRLAEADYQQTLMASHAHSWTDTRLVAELRAAMFVAVQFNERVVVGVRIAALVQILLAAIAAGCAAISLLTAPVQ